MGLSKPTTSKKSYELNIAGYPLRLKSHHDEALVQELVEYVNEQIRLAMTHTKTGSLQNAAILAAFNIAEEMALLKRKAYSELERLEEKALKLRTDLEESKVNKMGSDNSAN